MSTTDGLVIPVSTPGADKAAEDLGRVAAATVQVGQGAQEMGASVARGGTASTQALNAIGASAARSESHLADLKVTGNQALQELGQKGAEFARSIGGAGGAVAELGVKILATAGPYGAMAAAGVGAIGLIVNALKEHEATVARDHAVTRELAASTAFLGGSYPGVTAAINAATTAAMAHKAAMEAELNILQLRVAAMQSGASMEGAAREVDVIQRTVAARENLNAAMVTQALHTGNAATQETILGFAFRHSTDAAQEQINVQNALAVLADRTARRVADHARDANIQAVNNRRAAQQAYETALRSADAHGEVARAARRLETAETVANASFAAMNRTESEANRLHEAGTTALTALTNSTKDFENATKEAGRASHLASVASDAVAAARQRAAAAEAAHAAAERERHEEKLRQIQEETLARSRALAIRENNLQRILGMNQLEGFSSGELHDREHRAAMDAAATNINGLQEREEVDRKSRDLSNNRSATALAEARRVQSASGIMGAAAEKAGSQAALAVGASYAAIAAGANVGDVLQAQLKSTLSSIGQESAVQALFELAKGFSQLAVPVVGAAPAAAHFTSAAIFGATAAAAGFASAAIPSAAPAGGGGGAAAAPAPAPAAGGMGTMNTGTQTGGPTNTVINYYAPTFGGREGGIGEVGQQIDRYRRDNTALRRTRP